MSALPDFTNTHSTASEMASDRQVHLEALKVHLVVTQTRMKIQADRKCSDREFQVGEKVLLKLQPYAQNSVVNRPFSKLAFKYFDPYSVTAKVGPSAYRLDLPEGCLIHPVSQISQLKPFTPNYTPLFT